MVARPGETIYPILEGAPTGLVTAGTIGVRIVDAVTSAEVVARSTAIIEIEASGVYRAILTAPGVRGEYIILWDQQAAGAGALDPDLTSSDNLTVSYSADPVETIAPDALPYTPTLAQIGSETLGRTVDDVGNMTGTFSADTRPTDEQVVAVRDKALQDVSRAIGTEIPDALIDDAKRVTALRAAMLIELTLFGSEVATDRSPYKALEALYKELLLDLQSAVAATEAGGDPRDEIDGRMPAYGFGAPSTWMTRKM